ncbi:helix-turn-helix domain-containing protein [Nocardia sp. NPDC050712]|uniref:PucR family transcriptional regulator n=1 Tax=Nocardia sp. NPDC050712 TaxID=3155518 RepID=UPI0033DCA48E
MSFSTLDLSVGSPDTALRFAGQPASLALEDTARVASRIVDYFATCLAPCRTLPGEQLRGEVTTMTRHCLALIVELLDHQAVPDDEQLAQVRAAATQWAREGVPLEAILRAYHEGIRIGLSLATARANADDHSELLLAIDLILELLESVTVAATAAYAQEQRLVAREHHSAAQTLTSALLSGHGTSALVRQGEIPVAESYHVVALAIPAHADEQNPRIDAHISAQRKLRRVQSALAKALGSRALALFNPQGGTLLIPVAESASATVISDLRDALSAAAEVPVTAVVITTATDRIPDCADHAHELLELVRAARRQPGLYHPADLALEYQLTRSGPGISQLAATLDPLDKHPELLETIRVYLSRDLSRRLTARHLFIHPNTIDYRLRRIAQLTTIDLNTTAGISSASVALLARDLHRAKPAGT